jgi:DNA repair exonuclease SbcCD ATPase subunit
VLDKKELKRLKKEEARRLKEERKRAKEEAKRLKKAREKQVEVPPAEGAETIIAPPGEAPSEAVLDKKELKRLKKEEARRLKEERKRAKEEAKRLKKAREKQVEVPPAEGAGLFEEAPAAPEPPAAPWAGPTPSVAPEDSLAEERKPSLAGSEEMPLGFPSPPPSGVKLPRMEERLEEKPRPPEEIPLDLEPPEGFFE